ncbi:MAG: FAD-dependent oxidoreductase [Parasporobacterium sp.]|nr:FAD-dependent oxidoreductase [Parasporobacterium sp.]
MKVLIIGGVAAGTKAAAKIKRCDRDTEVKILTRSSDISYAGCGLPYYIGGDIESRDELIVNTPEKFAALTGAEVVTGCEVTSVDTAAKNAAFRMADGSVGKESYDKLIIATGAVPFVPQTEGIGLKGVFCVRTPDDAIAIRDFIEKNACKKAVVCGAGFIGLEVAENLKAKGLSVTVIDAAPTIMPNAFDTEMADYAKKQLQNANIRVLTGTKLVSVAGDTKVTGVQTDAGLIAADIAVIAIGVRPATAFLEGSGIAMDRGTVIVDEQMRTSVPDVYAAGDCAVVKNLITGRPQWSAMGSTANITGRLLAKNIVGSALCAESAEGTASGCAASYPGCLGTGVARLLPTLNCGRTGLTEEQAKEAGYDAVSVLCSINDKAHYYPGASSFIIKLIAERGTEKLLGIQVFGAGAVDKVVDVAVTGISMGAVLSDYNSMDFAYAPPFSTAIHPFTTACYILENKLQGVMRSITPKEYADGAAKGYKVIDVHPEPKITGARWVDLEKVVDGIDGAGKDEKLLLVCARGRRGYMLQNRLIHAGYTDTLVLEGGATFTNVKVERNGQKLPPEEIKRVKGLGCLQDKRFDDVFNVRIITRNGKINSAEQTAIAEAARRFGSGEVTMTTRLTLEIQGVPYDNLEDLFAFINENGLETGGTGSKVRPVVSCKGTTCQYGLIDTFALSEKLHDIYYTGYHGLVLPHKFKIAVGGCPNNCVKPTLNDIGIIGQRIPAFDPSKCNGCAVCQVEKSCPIHTAEVKDGKLSIDPEECNHCGRCIGKCPFGAVGEESVGYKIYIGGRWGKKIAHGQPLNRILHSEEEVIDIVDRAILFFRNEGITGERFSDTIERLGFEYVEDKLLNGEIDKSEIMNKKVTGGATC